MVGGRRRHQDSWTRPSPHKTTSATRWWMMRYRQSLMMSPNRKQSCVVASATVSKHKDGCGVLQYDNDSCDSSSVCWQHRAVIAAWLTGTNTPRTDGAQHVKNSNVDWKEKKKKAQIKNTRFPVRTLLLVWPATGRHTLGKPSHPPVCVCGSALIKRYHRGSAEVFLAAD